MGLFLSMSGLAGASVEAVKHGLRDFAASAGGRFEPARAEFPDALVLSEGAPERITVLYPGEFMGWDEASAHLSQSLRTPVFSFHIHDDDLWMYVLHVNREEVDHFNPIPEYWFDDLPDDERELWAGNPYVVAQHWPGIDADEIRNYLVHWDLDDEEPGKAYDDDQCNQMDCWQLTDFMRKLGLRFPMDERGQVLSETYRFVVPS